MKSKGYFGVAFLCLIGVLEAQDNLAFFAARNNRRSSDNTSNESEVVARNTSPAATQSQVLSQQGTPLNGEYLPAYNAPATIAVDGNWDVFADASFLYWFGGEEGLSVASDGVLSSGEIYFVTQTNNHYQSFDYKPGFKVSLGIIGQREWVVYSEYTWLRGHTSNRFNASTNGNTAGTDAALTGTPILLVDDWFLMGTSNAQALAASSITSDWKYALDLVDISVSRPFYQGSSLTVSPFGGLRAAWIRQSMQVSMVESTDLFLVELFLQANLHNRSCRIILLTHGQLG